MIRLTGIFIFFSLILSISSHSQEWISGKVLDAETGDPLAFVNIVIDDSQYGGATDIDGKFSIKAIQGAESLSLTYVGYEAKKYQLNGRTAGLKIYMQKIPVELREVVILPGINPAHRIIRNVVGQLAQSPLNRPLHGEIANSVSLSHQ